MSRQPYQVIALDRSPELTGWTDQEQRAARQWAFLGGSAGANTDFTPLTVKAVYIVGIVLNACKSVSQLLDGRALFSTTYYSAYHIFAGSVELLGRCVRGNESDSGVTADLRCGFEWLASPNARNDRNAVVQTKNYSYSIEDLVGLRHFAAHDQAINKVTKAQPSAGLSNTEEGVIEDFDYLLLGEMSPFLAQGMKAWLSSLQTDKSLATKLAQANIAPYRNRMVFDGLWGLQADAASYPAAVKTDIEKYDWRYKDDLKLLQTLTHARD